MIVTALAPKIGYANAAKIAKMANKNGTTFKEEVLKKNIISAREYAKIMDPLKTVYSTHLTLPPPPYVSQSV